MPPGPRAGFSMCIHKKRAVLFGGVVDMETEGKFFLSKSLNGHKDDIMPEHVSLLCLRL